MQRRQKNQQRGETTDSRRLLNERVRQDGEEAAEERSGYGIVENIWVRVVI